MTETTARRVDPASVSAIDVGRAVRELQREGLVTYPAHPAALLSIDLIPVIAQRLGFRKRAVRALRAELAAVQARRDETHIASVMLAGRQDGWSDHQAAAYILRGQGAST